MRIVLVLAVLAFSATAQAQSLVPFLKKNGKYIYVDSVSMKPVLTKEYATANLFNKDGLAYVNEQKHDLFEAFTAATTGYFIDKSGKPAMAGSHQLQSAYNEDGLAEIKIDGKTGLINKKGVIVVPAIWDEMQSYYNTLIPVKTNNKWGYCDKQGRLRIPAIYEDARNFSESRAFVKTGDKWSIIDTTGKIVSHVRYQNDSWFSDGMAIVTTDGKKWHNITHECKILVPSFVYTEMNSFSNGLASVKSASGKWGLMDKKGKLAIPFMYDSITYFSWKSPHILPAIKDGKWGAIDQKGKTIIPFTYENILPYYDNNITTFQSGGKWGIMDLKGKVHIPAMYKEIEVLNSNYVLVSSGSGWALADKGNKILTAFKYYPLGFNGSDFEEGYGLIELTDSPGSGLFESGFFIDLNGREYREK